MWAPGIAGLGPGGLLLAVGAFGPAVAAALVLHWRGEPLRPWLASITRWRVPLRSCAFALGLPVALSASVNLTLAALGERVELDRVDEALAAYPGSFLAVALIGGGQEEPGWRGFALGRLQERYSPLRATLVLGVIWGVWHLPLYGLAFVGPMMFVVFYTWLYNRTGSVLLCVLLHGSFTPALDHLVVVDDNPTVDLTIFATLVAAAVLIVLVTRGRLGFEPARETQA